jgi:FlaA1/EpsC-like NDP-sugar epimerase
MKEKNTAGRTPSAGARVARAILALPRVAKRFIMAIADAVAIPTALWVALVLKFDTVNPAADHTVGYFLVAVASALFFFSVFGLYRAVIRFVGPKAMLTVLAGVSLSVLVLMLFDHFVASHQIPLSAFGIYGVLALLYVGGSRFVARYLFQHTGIRGRSVARVAIYGAGTAGAHISTVLLGGPDYEPVAFIDDKKSLHGSSINGVRVYGSDVLPKLVRQHRIDRVLLAMPATTRRRRREILTQLEPLGVHVQSLPVLADLITGKAQISELRDVEVSDLLGRDPVPPKPKLFGSCIRAKCVLVTGAGGSIGSELCRQIIRLSPSRLVLFEMSEIALYNIER